jgi:hypothetical protein
VDDILFIYYQRKTNTDETLAEFNEQQPNIKFIIEKELHNSINILELSIPRREKELAFTTYRKPIQTDIIIRKDSCHPYEHKILSINKLVNRLNMYPISKEAEEREKTHYITINII